jgi:glycosyltransferase involved in cell wall biosynthesis
MHTAVVIPCLNEQETLSATCASLGFDAGRGAPAEAALILVDNGSTDSTKAVMREVERQNEPGRVIVVDEAQRGYVPPRHRGILEAQSYAAKQCIGEAGFLVLQADGDTIYAPNYIAEMTNVAAGRTNFIIEGIAQTPPEFLIAQSAYFELIGVTDDGTGKFAVNETEEVVVVDAVSGFLLRDYFEWGGHRREFSSQGDEIHAETSRLFLRAKTRGADRLRVGDALAFPSRRKVLIDPVLYFATQGFPQGAGWLARWNARYQRPGDFAAFSHARAHDLLDEAILLRRAHSLLLFGVLPVHVATLLGRRHAVAEVEELVRPLLHHIESVTIKDLEERPGKLFEVGLGLLEGNLDEIRMLLDR